MTQFVIRLQFVGFKCVCQEEQDTLRKQAHAGLSDLHFQECIRNCVATERLSLPTCVHSANSQLMFQCENMTMTKQSPMHTQHVGRKQATTSARMFSPIPLADCLVLVGQN